MQATDSPKATPNLPGIKVDLPSYILMELRQLHEKYRQRLSFFGGHPVSITKQSCNQIFSERNIYRQSPYLVCQKTDGVRYILLLALVDSNDHVEHGLNEDEDYASNQDTKQGTKMQAYMISRQTHSSSLVAYACSMKIAQNWQIPPKSDFKRIVEIIDGELTEDTIGSRKVLRYLIFDGLVHLGRKITGMKLKERIECIQKFLKCNQFLLKGEPPRKGFEEAIPMVLKDFFRLTCPKYITVEFLLRKYIKCLPHENDGVIFNHEEKEYILGGSNKGYIKWKPAHLNTLDFMVIPNHNLVDQYGKKVLDLYLAINHKECAFYNFTVVTEKEFQRIDLLYNQRKQEAFQRGNHGGNSLDANDFQGAIIAECQYQPTNQAERLIYSKLLDMKRAPSDIHDEIMRPENAKEEHLSVLQRSLYDKGWKVYKYREDKGMPNHVDTAEKIEFSIRDNITEAYLISENKKINDLSS